MARYPRFQREIANAEWRLSVQLERAKVAATCARMKETEAYHRLDLPWNDTAHRKAKSTAGVILAEMGEEADRERCQRGLYLVSRLRQRGDSLKDYDAELMELRAIVRSIPPVK